MNTATRYNLLQSTINQLTKTKNELFSKIERRGMDHRYMMSHGNEPLQAGTVNFHVGRIIEEIERLEEEMYQIRIEQNRAFWG